MKKPHTRLLPLLLAAAMTGLLPSVPAHAATQNIEACGDGTAMLGSLTAIEHSAFQVHLRLNAQHYSAYGNARADSGYVLEFLRREKEQARLADADYIIISAGLMDFIAPLQEQTDVYLQETGGAQFIDLFTDAPEEQLAVYADELAKCVTANQDALTEHYKAIAQELDRYDHAKVMLTTVYNPLRCCKTELSPEQQACYDKVSAAVDAMLTETVNPLIRELGETYGYTVVDAYSALDAAGDASPETLDPYPTSAGYEALGRAFLKAMDTPVPEGYTAGDVDKDGAVNASDAAQVLIHAAASGAASENGLLTITGELLSADYDHNGVINASDAARILIYSAEQGAATE